MFEFSGQRCLVHFNTVENWSEWYRTLNARADAQLTNFSYLQSFNQSQVVASKSQALEIESKSKAFHVSNFSLFVNVENVHLIFSISLS